MTRPRINPKRTGGWIDIGDPGAPQFEGSHHSMTDPDTQAALVQAALRRHRRKRVKDGAVLAVLTALALAYLAYILGWASLA